MTQRLDSSNLRDFLGAIDAFVFDCDGVLWRGSEVISGVPELIKKLKAMGKRTVFVTNNSTQSRLSYLGKFQKMGIPAELDDIVSSSYAAAYYLKHLSNFSGSVQVVGQAGVCDELVEAGIPIYGKEEVEPGPEALLAWTPREDVKAVVCGLALDLCYWKLARAHLYLLRPDVAFIATNDDSTFPMAGGRVCPGAGALVSYLATASGRQPLVMGKPYPPMLQCVADKFKLNPSRSCMVGDRLNTDIVFGQNGGMKTLLVLTGITSLEDLDDPSNTTHPDFVADSVLNLA